MFTATGYTGKVELKVYKVPNEDLRISMEDMRTGQEMKVILNERQEVELIRKLHQMRGEPAEHYDEEEANDFAEYERLFTENASGVGED